MDLSVSTREAEQVRRANESGKQPAVFVHGLWLLPQSWEAWCAYFEDRGFSALAVDWPGDQVSLDAARGNPDSLAGLSVTEIADHVAEVIASLKRKPILIGHSFGGLLVQMLAGHGLAAATIAIDPAPSKGVLPLPFSTIKASMPVLGNPLNRGRSVTLTFDQFRYGFANAVGEDEARALYDTFHTPAPGRPLFQAATANLNPLARTKVDKTNPERGPMLLISGERDNIVPFVLTNAAYKKQRKNKVAVTELVEIPGVGHSLVIDSGWSAVADVAAEFVTRQNLND